MSEQIYVARVTANAMAAGRFIALEAGEPVELTPAEAEDLLRVRFIVKASKDKAKVAPADGDEEETEEMVHEAETASLAPERTATAAAQHAKSKKGGGA